MQAATLAAQIAGFARARVLVLGDVIVDHFIWGSVSRISPEAPVPVVNVTREERLLGGSANVLRNILSLGGRADLCGLVGSDEPGRDLLNHLKSLGVSTAGLLVDHRPTTVKTRVVAQGQQVVRFDREQTGEPGEATRRRLIEFLEESLPRYDAVVVSDYAKGVVSEQVMTRLHRLLAQLRKKRPCPLVVDPKPVNAHRFIGATVITPNHHELITMTGMDIDDEPALVAAARQVQEELACEAVLVTRGETGMALLEQGEALVTIPTMAKEVYDVTGAGDTVVATLALGLSSGCSMVEAARLANQAAGIVVGKVGTASVTAAELLSAVS